MTYASIVRSRSAMRHGDAVVAVLHEVQLADPEDVDRREALALAQHPVEPFPALAGTPATAGGTTGRSRPPGRRCRRSRPAGSPAARAGARRRSRARRRPRRRAARPTRRRARGAGGRRAGRAPGGGVAAGSRSARRRAGIRCRSSLVVQLHRPSPDDVDDPRVPEYAVRHGLAVGVDVAVQQEPGRSAATTSCRHSNPWWGASSRSPSLRGGAWVRTTSTRRPSRRVRRRAARTTAGRAGSARAASTGWGPSR